MTAAASADKPEWYSPADSLSVPPAIALVESDDVGAAGECLIGQTAHVVGVARALESVQDDHRRVIPGLGLPMTVSQHSCVSGHVEVPAFGLGQTWEMAGPAPGVQRHPVTAF